MTNHIKILSLALILLVLTFLVFTKFNQNHAENKHNTKRLFLNFEQKIIASFEVNSFTNGHLFKKNAQNEWLVKKHANALVQELQKNTSSNVSIEDKDFQNANSQDVSKALTYFLELKDLEPISTTPMAPDTYEINKHSLHLIFYNSDGKVLDKIYIGKHGPDPMTSFLKRADSDEVYLAPQDFKLLFYKNFEDWLLKKTQ